MKSIMPKIQTTYLLFDLNVVHFVNDNELHPAVWLALLRYVLHYAYIFLLSYHAKLLCDEDSYTVIANIFSSVYVYSLPCKCNCSDTRFLSVIKCVSLPEPEEGAPKSDWRPLLRHLDIPELNSPITDFTHFLFQLSYLSNTGVLNLFKLVAQLINKRKVHGPPTMQLLQCDNCCICKKKNNI